MMDTVPEEAEHYFVLLDEISIRFWFAILTVGARERT